MTEEKFGSFLKNIFFRASESIAASLCYTAPGDVCVGAVLVIASHCVCIVSVQIILRTFQRFAKPFLISTRLQIRGLAIRSCTCKMQSVHLESPTFFQMLKCAALSLRYTTRVLVNFFLAFPAGTMNFICTRAQNPIFAVQCSTCAGLSTANVKACRIATFIGTKD
jgi:hypothetical protein